MRGGAPCQQLVRTKERNTHARGKCLDPIVVQITAYGIGFILIPFDKGKIEGDLRNKVHAGEHKKNLPLPLFFKEGS
jgi:hypothetical protein